MTVSVRPARPGDGEALHRLVVALAEHQHEAHLVTSTPEQIEAVLCAGDDRQGCFVAEADGAIVGFAYWYTLVTTYTAQTKLYMEDLCVLPEARGQGAGLALMRALAQLCMKRGYRRFEWLAMEDNEVGKAFYRRIGGKVKRGAETWQMWGDDVRMLAEG
jgi:ribosomal protein S18 acetylase RimI-like enzyme